MNPLATRTLPAAFSAAELSDLMRMSSSLGAARDGESHPSKARATNTGDLGSIDAIFMGAPAGLRATAAVSTSTLNGRARELGLGRSLRSVLGRAKEAVERGPSDEDLEKDRRNHGRSSGRDQCPSSRRRMQGRTRRPTDP